MRKPTYAEAYHALLSNRFSKWSKERQEQALALTEGDLTVLLIAAQYGRLWQVDKDLLTRDNLLQPTSDRITALHWAGASGELDKIPKHLITEDTLHARNDVGGTPLHWAAANGHLDQIPKEFLTEKSLTVPNNEGTHALNLASEHNHLPSIPFIISPPTLKKLLLYPPCTEKSRRWIQKEIQKENLKTALSHCQHPEL